MDTKHEIETLKSFLDIGYITQEEFDKILKEIVEEDENAV